MSPTSTGTHIMFLVFFYDVLCSMRLPSARHSPIDLTFVKCLRVKIQVYVLVQDFFFFVHTPVNAEKRVSRTEMSSCNYSCSVSQSVEVHRSSCQHQQQQQHINSTSNVTQRRRALFLSQLFPKRSTVTQRAPLVLSFTRAEA